MEKAKKPIVILTGFLGSGKSTLIRGLLADPSLGVRFAVILNEFSVDSGGVERNLFQASDGEIFAKFYEMPNGCMCCTDKTEVFSLIEMLSEQSEAAIDCFVVESNGLADISRNIKALWADEGLEFRAEICSVVCLVDASRFEKLKSSDALFVKQMAISDLIVLNKTDLVSAEKAEQISAEIKSSFDCEVFVTNQAKIPVEVLLKKRFCHADFELSFAKWKSMPRPAETIKTKAQSEAFQFPPEAVFDPVRLEQEIGKVIWEDYADRVYRCKAVFRSKEECLMELQGYDEVFEIRKTGVRDKKATSKFMFIGRELDRKLLLAALEKAIETKN